MNPAAARLAIVVILLVIILAFALAAYMAYRRQAREALRPPLPGVDYDLLADFDQRMKWHETTPVPPKKGSDSGS